MLQRVIMGKTLVGLFFLLMSCRNFFYELEYLARYKNFEGFYYEDLAYGTDPFQKIDLLTADSSEGSIVIILVHGGAFYSDDKISLKEKSRRTGFTTIKDLNSWYKENHFEGIEELLSFQYIYGLNDINSVNMNYRLAKIPSYKNDPGQLESDVIKQIEDVHSVVELTTEYFPNSKIILFGHSSGATVSLLYDLFYPGTISRVAVFAPGVDTVGLWGMPEELSPLARVSEYRSDLEIVLIHGISDIVIPYTPTQEFYESSSLASRKRLIITSWGHFWTYDEEEFQKFLKWIVEPF